VELRVDCDTITSNGYINISRRSLVEKIRHLIRFNWKVVVHHFYREANQCANVLVNIKCSMMEVYVSSLMRVLRGEAQHMHGVAMVTSKKKKLNRIE
jgi:hypothetical protein